MESVIVILVVAVASWYLWTRFARALKNEAPSCGCGGSCGCCPSKSIAESKDGETLEEDIEQVGKITGGRK